MTKAAYLGYLMGMRKRAGDKRYEGLWDYLKQAPVVKGVAGAAAGGLGANLLTRALIREHKGDETDVDKAIKRDRMRNRLINTATALGALTAGYGASLKAMPFQSRVEPFWQRMLRENQRGIFYGTKDGNDD